MKSILKLVVFSLLISSCGDPGSATDAKEAPAAESVEETAPTKIADNQLITNKDNTVDKEIGATNPTTSLKSTDECDETDIHQTMPIITVRLPGEFMIKLLLNSVISTLMRNRKKQLPRRRFGHMGQLGRQEHHRHITEDLIKHF